MKVYNMNTGFLDFVNHPVLWTMFQQPDLSLSSGEGVGHTYSSTDGLLFLINPTE
jgi:hypothetical protein